MARLVFEIGTEEIPARFFAGALEQLKSLAVERLAAARLGHGEVSVYATPRRIALIVEGLAERQESRMREEQGPPAPRAFNADGTPNQAAIGFAGRWGVKPEELQVKPTARGDYIFAIFKEEGKSAVEILQELLPALPPALSFPKTMRWGTGSLRFARPIRWLVALLDNTVIEFDLDGLKSGRETRGHPVLHPKPIVLASAADYEKALKKAKVILDQQERRRALVRQLKAIERQEKAKLADSDDLIEETVFLIEWPTAVCGGFAENYLKLPRPVLMEEMKKVQGFFPLQDAEGKLIARFIGVRDGGKLNLEGIKAGYEGVLRAKFEDATYFYEHDLRVSLDKRLEQLKGLVYHAGMGTMYDKAQRLRELAGYIAEKLGLDAPTKAAAERAALLCKADLVTDLVVEITSLQGVMGREYALVAGESAEVAEAIGEHYRPRFAGDSLPQSQVGRIVAFADKLDTIVTGLAAGLSVTGSADPYGLRREGQGIVALLVEGKLHLSLREMTARSLELLRAQQEVKRQPEEIEKNVADLLKQRIERLLEDNPPLGKGLRYDLTDAALGVGADDCAQAIARAEALKKLARRADFLPTVVAATRPANIVKGFAGGEPDPALFTAPTEKLLWDQCLAAKPKIEELAKKGDYTALFEVLASLRKTIDRFFDDVLVMDKDERIKQNRLALVWQIDRLFRHLADFRLIVQE